MDLIDSLYIPAGISNYKMVYNHFNRHFELFLEDVTKCVTKLALQDKEDYFGIQKSFILTFILSRFMDSQDLNYCYEKYLKDNELSFRESINVFFAKIDKPARDFLFLCSDKELSSIGLKRENLIYIEKIANMNISNSEKRRAIKKYLDKIIIPNNIDNNKILEEKEYAKYLDEVNYVFDSGRRICPTLMYLSYDLTDKAYDKNLLHTAFIIEFMHKFSLIIDDLYDNDDYRRGKETFKKKYGYDENVNMVNYLTIIFSNLTNCNSKKDELLNLDNILGFYSSKDNVAKELLKTWKCFHEGILEELEVRSKEKPLTMEECLDIDMKQSSVIIASAMKLGYCLGEENPSEKIVELLNDIGAKCGILLQIINDIEIFLNEKYQKGTKFKLNYDLNTGSKNFVVSQIPVDMVREMTKEDKINYINDFHLSNKTVIIAEEKFKEIITLVKQLPRSVTRTSILLFLSAEKTKLNKLTSQKKYNQKESIIKLQFK